MIDYLHDVFDRYDWIILFCAFAYCAVAWVLAFFPPRDWKFWKRKE